MVKKGFYISGALVILFFVLSGLFVQKQPPNVLFICIDDLRPDLKCYGNTEVRSPNLDALAAESSLFTRHYVTQPTCGASRFSLLTGRRPRTPIHLTNEAIEREISGKPRSEIPETFVDHFRQSGYYTVGIGKISHSPDGYVYGYEEPRSNQLELPHSWDEMLLDAGKWITGWNAFFAYADGTNRQTHKGEVKPYESAKVPDEGYPDGLSAQLAVTKLNELAKKSQPFFLSVGFFKPHLPFNAPQKYWDLYDESKLSLTPSPDLPTDVNPASLHNSGEFNSYKAGDENASLTKPVSDAYARKLRHAYYAGVSYTDAQVGKVLDELKRLKLDKNTIVVVWSDHGWHLGDYRVWGKHTIFERAVRSVLMVKVPQTAGGQQRDEIVSSIDIYPTLLELCSLKPVGNLDGQSFVRLLKKKKAPAWENVAYSYFNRGVSLRTDRYRFTKYFRKQEPIVELYDHQVDPNENHNVAKERPEVVEKLTPLWAKGNTGVYQ
ncbi:sulfatase [Salmonirosea aquatica]|uniref:Sulfatase-like hydrolase/transferase n=1 Tax=Salmonirosea aquatica TaxID=2654236 RepID=A0A7C9BC16_9BACT|nr:sulfatase-like hydrolase/transferase [Cytophagaceae bacterium SJW1-29]